MQPPLTLNLLFRRHGHETWRRLQPLRTQRILCRRKIRRARQRLIQNSSRKEEGMKRMKKQFVANPTQVMLWSVLTVPHTTSSIRDELGGVRNERKM